MKKNSHKRFFSQSEKVEFYTPIQLTVHLETSSLWKWQATPFCTENGL